MNEPKRISKLLSNLYDGVPWIDVTILPTIESVNAEKASKKLRSDVNSIWEITNHLISWHAAVLIRLSGGVPHIPDNNFFQPVADVSEAAWQQTQQQFKEIMQKWISFLQNFDENKLDELPTAKSPMTNYEIIHGIIQHDAYHLGQIKLLTRILSE